MGVAENPLSLKIAPDLDQDDFSIPDWGNRNTNKIVGYLPFQIHYEHEVKA